ncbi:hypothetical protein [Methylomonas fluvii]|uniref:Uncharacterized protein n=1 Tax=Methylomonas fluvii TaxID=1854564 RepID=A0ABR9D8W4_9GAMM|nr:hypothetical protein [Methylomonas fluvii]MBD9359201.1 hypothetical protein [Methylomonas fluvii]CAD6871890.1 hypothetical protein [Methylomonas fluvii]
MTHLNSVNDLREYIKGLGEFRARPIVAGQHPTLYIDHSQGAMIKGIREKDYLFSPCKNWVEPHEQMGLSFSAGWNHLKDQIKLKRKWNKDKSIDINWLLASFELPAGLRFVQDTRDSQHYLLTVTERMTIDALVAKLLMIADRMAVYPHVERFLK